ncbi:MAG: hypothetical protein ACI85O_001940 [Saprospiraceae bacterium]|jgi:hypothetical protein
MKISNQAKRLFGTFLHACFLLILTLFWLNRPNTYSDEAFFIKWTSLVKKTVFGIDPKPRPDEVLFIDISDNKTVIPKLDEFGEYNEYSGRVVVNRAHLAELLSIIQPYKERIKHIFININFEDETPADSIFLSQAESLRDKILTAARLDEEGNFVKSHFDLPYALATYEATQGLFMKYRLFYHDTLKTVPLALYENIDNKKLERGLFFTRISGKTALRAPIVDFQIRPIDMKPASDLVSETYTAQSLSTLLSLREFMDPEDFAAFFQDRLIIIGDFENDIHQTVFGSVPGSLVIYNSYLTLKKEAYHISAAWIIFLLLSFWFLSYTAFVGIEIQKISGLFKKNPTGLEGTVTESFVLIVITILSYAIFDIHINILILILYLSAVTYLWEKFKKRQQRKREKLVETEKK